MVALETTVSGVLESSCGRWLSSDFFATFPGLECVNGSKWVKTAPEQVPQQQQGDGEDIA